MGLQKMLSRVSMVLLLLLPLVLLQIIVMHFVLLPVGQFTSLWRSDSDWSPAADKDLVIHSQREGGCLLT